MLVDDVRVQERRGRRQRDLEAKVLRDRAFLAQPAKNAVGLDGRLRVAQIADAHVLRPRANPQAEARWRWSAPRNDRAPRPGARALGRMSDPPTRRHLLRVVLECEVVLQRA